MSECMEFDLTPIEIPVTIDGEEYLLREASGGTACRYRNAVLACITLVDGKPAKITNQADTEPLLVSLCMLQVVRDANGEKKGEKAVPVTTVRQWRSSVQKALFKKAKEISDLEEPPTERELLVKALGRADAPCSAADFEEWLTGLGDEYKPLVKWLALTPEERAKKEPSATTASSG